VTDTNTLRKRFGEIFNRVVLGKAPEWRRGRVRAVARLSNGMASCAIRLRIEASAFCGACGFIVGGILASSQTKKDYQRKNLAATPFLSAQFETAQFEAS
jgi:hypothetical protein